MEQARTHTPNSGTFKKGYTPWNKGTHKGGRAGLAQKGKQGAVCRPVVAIAPDGTVAHRYPSVKEAARATGRGRCTITNACKGKNRCLGMVWKYEDEYVAWADYSYRPNNNRDERGRLVKGHGFRPRLSEKETQRKRERMRERSKSMCADPDNKWGKGTCHPVRCLTTGEDFPSVTAAAERFGVKPHAVTSAMHAGCRVKGKYRFARI